MMTHVTVADLARPSEKRLALLYDASLVLAGSAWIALCTQVAFGQPIPKTGQTFAVLLVGALLGPRLGASTVLAYIAEGLIGLPVFARGTAGPAALAWLTGGYLVGFVPAAYVVGLLARRGWDRHVITAVLAMVAGNAVLYSFGLAWLYYLARIGQFQASHIIEVGLYPFLLGDTVKIALAVAILPSAWKIFRVFGVDKIAKMC